jgi:predicted transcriptional regulator
MVTFSCKKISQEDLIRCSFDLNKTEYNLFVFLFKKETYYSVIEISKLMNLDRTTIQKAIKILLNKKLLKRTQKNISKGGYIFLYKIYDKKEIKIKMKKITIDWSKGIEKAIENL